jgi:hypothetical protein
MSQVDDVIKNVHVYIRRTYVRILHAYMCYIFCAVRNRTVTKTELCDSGSCMYDTVRVTHGWLIGWLFLTGTPHAACNNNIYEGFEVPT